MNRKQKIILWVAIGVVVGMGIYPPWTNGDYGWIFEGKRDVFITESESEYYALPEVQITYFKVDIIRLIIQWTLIGILTGGLLFTFNKAKK